MRYCLTLLCVPLLLISSAAAAQDSPPDDGFLGSIGPTTEDASKENPWMTLEQPKPPTHTQVGQNGEVVLTHYRKNRLKVTGTNNRFIDGKFYTENEALDILELHYGRRQQPLQYQFHKRVESQDMIRMHGKLKTIATDISLYIIRE